MSRTAFNAWVAQATRGQQIEYHRGHLVRDRASAAGRSEHQRRKLSRTANAALAAAEAGRVHLVQRRHALFDFSYIAIKASSNVRPSAAMSDLRLPVAA